MKGFRHEIRHCDVIIKYFVTKSVVVLHTLSKKTLQFRFYATLYLLLCQNIHCSPV